MWIAFNLITFVDITQRLKTTVSIKHRCELLSIWLLLWISHSPWAFTLASAIVVNCFQFDYFCGYHTANPAQSQRRCGLWIAFNLITFVDITQLLNSWEVLNDCCELLSIWLLLWISHSHLLVSFWVRSVVNCFQFDYFCGYHTADRDGRRLIKGVVNCFQFDYFCGYHTAANGKFKFSYKLWIAFNLITFVDITQLRSSRYHTSTSCELLSIWLLLWISHSFSPLPL